jgi:hypothetical protein
MAEYALPDLPYDYGALEPHYSGEIVELHHDKHLPTLLAPTARSTGWQKPVTTKSSDPSWAWRRRWPLTSPVMCSTRSSGRTSPLTVGTDQRANWQQPS